MITSLDVCHVAFVAYIGPGLGGGVIALILGFLLSIFLAVYALVWFPIKKFFKRVRELRATSRNATGVDFEADT